MRRFTPRVLYCLVFSIGGSGFAGEGIDFSHDVVPILRQHCAACHGGNESKGGFSLNTRGLLLDADVVSLSHPAQSRLLELVASTDPDDQMPPQEGPRLTGEEIATLRKWIESSLPWETGFTFAESRYEPPLLPRRPHLPASVEGRSNPVDRILDAYLVREGVKRPEPLGDAAFMRRVTLDLTGLLPSQEDLDAFLDDDNQEKRTVLIDKLLNDKPAYAAHWLSFWNDLLRNAYSGTGYIDGGRRQITAWLYRSVHDNKPFDQFVRELIDPSAESDGFVRGIKWRGNVNASQTRDIQFAQSITQVFLGINMKCASCHDSFIDRWTLKETYALAAVYADQPLELHRCDKPQGTTAEPAWIFPELGTVDPAAPPQARLNQLASLMTHPQNGRLTRTIANRVWHRLMGRGIVHPVDAMHTKAWNEDLLDYLAVHLSDHTYDLKQLLRVITTSSAYQSQTVDSFQDSTGEMVPYAGPLAKRMTAEQFLDAIWMVTNTWPHPAAHDLKRDGRQQGGQLGEILTTLREDEFDASLKGTELVTRWQDFRMRAAFTKLDSLQGRLGRPNREQIVSERPSELTTLQAITLANGARMADLMKRGAGHLVQSGGAADALIDTLYVQTLSRKPSDQELEVCRSILGENITQESVEDLLWTVVMHPDFQMIR